MKTNTKPQILAAFLVASISGVAQPIITTQPANQPVNQGFNATFRTVATTTSPPLSYQWYFNSNTTLPALTNTLTLLNAQPTNAGAYFAVVTDLTGSSTSRVATLTVIPPAPLDPKLSVNIRLGE